MLKLRDGKRGYADFTVNLYAALYSEARGNASDAQQFMTAALATDYARKSDDFMADVARVHVKERGW